ncbi:MAG TPA: 3-hydroxyacyl-CoA dehydrogenase family protein [Candidatus Dormibacteraeota bacterium]|nr:3-hydroxyacyl-CoA dehydrogenase family protein [Candidatus Dormibacteraeota bacterium]
MEQITVVGAGLMGSSIALVYARAGHDVRIHDVDPARIESALRQAGQMLDDLGKAGLGLPGDAGARSRLSGSVDLGEAVRGADVVAEAIVEDVAAKRALYAHVEGLVGAQAVIASNTSGLQPSDLSAEMAHPERFLVAHFWNPPHLIRLVEVVPGARTAERFVAATTGVLARAGQRAVVVRREVPGFIGNRLQYALLREALHLVRTGVASAEEVDAVVTTSFGRRLATVGPIATADLGGLHTFSAISRQLFPDLAAGTEELALLDEHVARGELGAPTRHGFYDWSEGELERTLERRNQVLMQLLRDEAAKG